jgi:hypothetical protein
MFYIVKRPGTKKEIKFHRANDFLMPQPGESTNENSEVQKHDIIKQASD